MFFISFIYPKQPNPQYNPTNAAKTPHGAELRDFSTTLRFGRNDDVLNGVVMTV